MKFHFTKSSLGSARIVVVLMLAIAFTLLCVSVSQQKGRLSASPTYDDVVYLEQGALLLQAARTEGFAGVRSFVDQHGLHSPYSIGLAAAAFAVLGPKDSSPYYANALLVALYLGGIAWLCSHLRTGAWLAVLLLALSLTFMTTGVVEFRPDIAWAVTTGFGAVFMVTRDALFRRPGRAAFAGFCLGISLLVKTPTFLMTSLLFIGAVVSRLGPAWRDGRHRLFDRKALLGALVFVVAALIVAGPYGFRFRLETWNYFFDNVFGAHKDVWTYHGGTRNSLLYYLSGQAADSNLGRSGLVMVLASLCATAYLLVRRPQMHWQILSLAVLASGAFLVNTVAPIKSPFVGGGIYGVAIFGGFYLIGMAWKTLAEEQRTKTIGTYALWGAAVAAMWLYQWPRYSDWTQKSVKKEVYLNATQFIHGLLDQHATNPPRRILVMQAGPIVPEVVSLWFPFHGLKADVTGGLFISDSATFASYYPQFEWVVIQEPGMIGSTRTMPSEPHLAQFLEILRADSDYQPIAEYQSPDDRKLWVFARRPAEPEL